MLKTTVSKSERAFVELGVKQMIRNDGRSPRDFRPISVDADVLPQAMGSARVTIGKCPIGGNGGTDVLATIKGEVVVPTDDRPLDGAFEVCVDVASSLFVGVRNRRDMREEMNAELSGAVTRFLANTLPLQSLCIMPSRFAWRLYVDVVVLQSDGNVLDAVSFAVWTALQRAKLPVLVPVEAEAGHEDNFVLDSNPEHATALDVAQVPLNVTVTAIGGLFVLDASRHEEACGEYRVAVAVNKLKECCGIYQVGSSVLSPVDLESVLECAQVAAASIFSGLEEATTRRPGERGKTNPTVNDSGGTGFPDIPLQSAGFFA